MPDRPELPEQFRSVRGSVFSVLPDERPMRWSIWNLDGCVGEISLNDGVWSSHPEPEGVEKGELDGTHQSWADAIVAVVSA